MNLTVFGANGGVGVEIVRQAVSAGHSVTAVVRDSSTFTLEHRALGVVRVPNLIEASGLAPALTGADAVLSAIGPRGRKDGPVASSATSTILAGMHAAGVRRIVAVSAAPVGPVAADEGFLNRRLLLPLISTLLRDLYADLAEMEAAIARSGTDWTVLRPPKLTNGRLRAQYRTQLGGAVPRGYSISRADAAHAMLAAIDDSATFGQVLGVAY